MLFLFFFKGIKGCYSNQVLEFYTQMSHLPLQQLTPMNCIKACQSMNYDLAALYLGKMCLCKLSKDVSNTISSMDNCTQIACRKLFDNFTQGVTCFKNLRHQPRGDHFFDLIILF